MVRRDEPIVQPNGVVPVKSTDGPRARDPLEAAPRTSPVAASRGGLDPGWRLINPLDVSTYDANGESGTTAASSSSEDAHSTRSRGKSATDATPLVREQAMQVIGRGSAYTSTTG